MVRGGGEVERQSNDFVLGQEPQGGIALQLAKETDVKPSTASRFLIRRISFVLLFDKDIPKPRFPFLQRVTNSLERRPKPKTEPKISCGIRNNDTNLNNEKSTNPEPYYEEIAVMKKRKKKERPTTPTPSTKDLYEEVKLLLPYSTLLAFSKCA